MSVNNNCAQHGCSVFWGGVTALCAVAVFGSPIGLLGGFAYGAGHAVTMSLTEQLTAKYKVRKITEFVIKILVLLGNALIAAKIATALGVAFTFGAAVGVLLLSWLSSLIISLAIACLCTGCVLAGAKAALRTQQS